MWNELATGNGSADTYTISGNFTNNATTFNAIGTGIHTFSGAAKILSGNTATTIPSVAVTGTLTNNGTMTVGTALSDVGGLINGATGILTIGGTSTITTLTVSAAGNTVNYNGAGAQTVKTVAYSNLTLSGSGIKTLSAGMTTIGGNLTMSGTATATLVVNIAVAGDLNIGTGTQLNLGAFTVNRNTAGGTLTVAGTLLVSGTNNFPTNYNTFTTTGTVNYANAGPQTVVEYNYNNLTLSGSGVKTLQAATTTIGGNLTMSGTATATLVANIDVAGNLTIGTGTQLDLAAFTANRITAGGTLTVAGTLLVGGTTNSPANYTTFTNTGGTVNYTYAGPQTVTAYNYNNLTLSGSGVKTLQAATTTIAGNFSLSGTATATTAANLAISGNLGVGSGTTFAIGTNFTLGVTGTSSITGTLTLAGTGAKTFTGNTTINSGGVWNETGVAAINFAGNLQHDGTTFTANTGVHTFTGTTKIISGASAIAIPSLTISGTTTNNGTLTVSTTLAGASTLTNGATGALNFGGASITPTLTATAVGNTVNYTGTGQTLKVTAYHHLTLSGGAETFGAITTIAGNLTLSGTATATTVANLAISGNLGVGSGTTFATSANFTLGITGTSSITGTLTLAGTGAKTFTGNTTINSVGVWNETGVAAINFAGNLQNDGTTFNANTGVHTFNGAAKTIGGTSAVAIPSATFTGAYTNSGTLTSSTLLTVTGVTLTNNGTITTSTALSGTGGLTQGSTGVLNLGGTSGITTLTVSALGNSVNYSGAAQTINAATYDNLTINQSSGNATLGGAATVNGVLTLSSGNLAVTDPQVLTMGASATTSGSGEVTGIVSRTTLVGNTSYSFGSQYTTIRFNNTGTLPTAVSVKITIGSSPTGMPNAVTRYYEVVRTGAGTGSTASIHFHYLDTELNGSTDHDLVMWDANAPFSSWAEIGRSSYDLTNNWIGTALYNATNFPTSFGAKMYTLGATANVSLEWNGSVSSVWTDPNNWTPAVIPSDISNVVIPDASTTPNDPTLDAAVSVGTMTMQNGGILNASASTVLTVTGGVGAWSDHGGTFNAGTSTVIFTNASATSSGSTDFYNVTIDAGASLHLSNGAFMHIGGTITNNGTFYASSSGSNTVEYQGADQTVLNVSYDNLILAGSGTKTMPAADMNFNGSLAISGTASVSAGGAITTTGSLTVGSGASYSTGSYAHTIGGNLTNDGTFTAVSSLIHMNGSSAQVLGGSGSLTINTLRCNNTAGVSLGKAVGITTLTISDVTANSIFSDGGFAVSTAGTLTLNSGTYNCAASVFPWGTFNAGTGTVNYNRSGDQTVAARTYNNLILSGSGAKTVSGITIGAAGTLDIQGTATATGTSPTYTSGATLKYSGSSAQVTGVELVSSITNLTINDASGITLSGTTTVTGQLNFNDGKITTGGNRLIIGSSASVNGAGAGKYVNGNLEKIFSTGAQSFIFFVGDGTNYEPVTLSFANVTAGGNVTVATVGSEHPDIANSGLNPLKSVNRYWMFTNDGVTYTTYEVVLNFDTSDFDAAPDNFIVAKKDGSVWTMPVVGTKTATSIQATGLTSMSDFAVGEIVSSTITFESNEGSSVTPITQNYGTSVSAPSAPTKTGYTFGEWYSDAELTSTYTFTTMPASDITLYAKWTIDSYAVTFDNNTGSGSMSSQSSNYNVAANLTSNTFTKTGYTFAGWNTAADGSGTSYTDAVSYSFTSSVTVYAKWTINSYSVTFDNNTGTGSMSIQNSNYNVAANLTSNTFTKTGYTFAGWNSAANGSGTGYVNAASYSFTSSTTMYAQWTINSYAVTFDNNTGSGSMSIQNSNYNVAANLTSNTFTKTGYTFAGWNSAADGSGTSYTDAVSYSFVSSVTFYAKWMINSYTVTFDANTGSGSMSIQNSNYNVAANLTGNTFTKTGYTFAGWNTSADGLGTSYTDAVSYSFTSSVTLYAKWAINSYTITFSVDGGSSVTAITQNFNTSVSIPDAPTKTGYTFGEWYSDAELTSTYTFTTMPASDITLYAKWAIDSYAVTFDNNTGTGSMSIQNSNYNVAANLTGNTFTKTGYTFAGWNTSADGLGTSYADAVSYSFTSSVTLYAQWTINSYAVTFDNNTGTGSMSIQNSNYNVAANLTSNTFTKTDYTFAGWNTAADGSGTSYTDAVSYSFTSSVTLYAKWAINSYTITFSVDGGSSVTAITQNYGTSVSAPSAPTKTGYTFDGWYSNAGLTSAYTFTTMPASDIMLYAKWTINSYAVTFDNNTGTGSMSIQNSNYNVAANLTSNTFTKTGYTFAGWNSAANGSGTDYVNAASYSFTSSTTMYAQWTINSYAVTFDNNTGTGSMSIQNSNYNVVANLTNNTFTKTGYTFAGWNTSADGLGTSYTDAVSYSFASSVTLYAKWTINTYAVTFDNNTGSGTMSDQSANYNISTALTTNTFTKTGYTFSGWNSAANGSGTSYVDGANYDFTANMTLYAQWTIVQHTVSFNANTGSGSMSSQTENYNRLTSLKMNAFTKTGYTFSGWNTAANGSGTSYVNGASYNFTADMTLYAQWTSNIYVVTFDANTGSGSMSDQSANYNISTALTSNAFTKTGYTFAGWNTVAVSGGVDYANGASYPFTTSGTLYAQWTINSYSVSFDNNTGTGSMSIQSSNYNVAANLTGNTFTKTGYTFAGWNTSADGLGTSYADAVSYSFTSSVTLYAKWTINSYAVTFDKNTGTGSMSSQNSNYNVAANLTSNTFTKTGYTFAGWNTSVDGLGTSYTDASSYPFTASVTLYAKWTINSYAVTFDNNTGTGSMSIQSSNYNVAANLTANTFTKTGYTFAGWNTSADGLGTSYTDAVSYSFASSVTLYAKWTINSYAVTFDQNTGTGSMSVQNSNYNVAANLTSNTFTKTGYAFAGWNTVAVGGGVAYANGASYPFTASGNLYAQWTINSYTLTYSSGPNGTITGTSLQNVNHGASGTAVTAVAASGYHFVDWSDASTSNPRTDESVTGNISVTANFTINQIRFAVKVFLQGPYNSGTGLMNTTLCNDGILASHFPTDALPYHAVDSINIEIRDSLTTAGSLVRKSIPAWLMPDGSIRSFSDTANGYVTIDTTSGSYYVIIHHRNHIAIMSSTSISLTADLTTYDFTTAMVQAYGVVTTALTTPMAELTGSGPFGMFAGDINGNGQIKLSGASNDRGLIYVRIGGGAVGATVSGYFPEDTNMDGTVKFIGSKNDAGIIYMNIGSGVTGAVRNTRVPQ